MFYLEEDGSLTVFFDPTSSVTELLTDFKNAIDGHALLQTGYHLQHPGVPEDYFDGLLVIERTSSRCRPSRFL
jgi:hypothetical protein